VGTVLEIKGGIAMKEWMKLNLQAVQKSKDQIEKEQWIQSQEWEMVYWHNDNGFCQRGNDPWWFIDIHESLMEEDLTQQEIVDRLYFDNEFSAGDEDLGIRVYLTDI
jgi:hypothetical protein